MNYTDVFKQAIDSLKTNKNYAFLTILSILVGVFSVISIFESGKTLETLIDKQFEIIGVNDLTIKEEKTKFSYRNNMKVEDIEYLRSSFNEIENIYAGSKNNGELTIDRKKIPVRVNGVTSEYIEFESLNLIKGDFFTSDMEFNQVEAVIINEILAIKFFGTLDVLGKEVNYRGITGRKARLEIIGVMKGSGARISHMKNDNFTSEIIIPLSVYKRINSTHKVDQIELTIKKGIEIDELGIQIINLLQGKYGENSLFIAEKNVRMEFVANQVKRIASKLISYMGFIAFLLAGVGTMNILLLSSDTRIKEVGVRKAIGAQRKDIMYQFIAEAIVITGIGGVIGIVLGVLVTNIVALSLGVIQGISLMTIVISFTVSIMVGLIFGVYPAVQAANIEPIKALHYE